MPTAKGQGVSTYKFNGGGGGGGGGNHGIRRAPRQSGDAAAGPTQPHKPQHAVHAAVPPSGDSNDDTAGDKKHSFLRRGSGGGGGGGAQGSAQDLEASLLEKQLQSQPPPQKHQWGRRAGWLSVLGAMAASSFRLASSTSDSVRPPRLRTDWTSIDSVHLPGLVSQELFFNVLYAVVFNGRLAGIYRSHGMAAFALVFLSFWNVWASWAAYATRFNDSDLFHWALWSLHGGGLLSVLVHLMDPLKASWSFASLHLILAAAYARVVSHLPRARPMAGTFMLFQILNAVSWIFAGRTALDTTTGTPLQWTSVAGFPISILCVVMFLPKRHDLPMTIEYQVTKHSQATGMVLAGVLAGLGGALDPATVDKAEQPGLYSKYLLGFVFVFCLKSIIDQLFHVPLADHAIRRSRLTAITWIFCQPLTVGSIALTGFCLSKLVASHADPEQEPQAREAFSKALGVLLTSIAVLRAAHRQTAALTVSILTGICAAAAFVPAVAFKTSQSGDASNKHWSSMIPSSGLVDFVAVTAVACVLGGNTARAFIGRYVWA